MENHLDFHFADTDILQEGRVETGMLRVADLTVKLVILPPMRVVEPPLAEWLAAFEAAGGRVMRCSPVFAADDMLAAIREHVAPSLSVQAAGREAAAVQVVKRVGGGRTLWFVLNAGSERLTVTLDSGGILCEIPLDGNQSPRLERHRRPVCPGRSSFRIVHAEGVRRER